MRGALLPLIVGLVLSAPAAAREPAFDPLAYFAGTTLSAGTMTDAFGAPRDRLTGTTRGRRSGAATEFDQTIRFDDGTIRRRTWRIVRTGPATVEATGSDVVGTARGEIRGRTLHLVSTIRAQEGNPLTDVDFDQTMVLGPDGRTLTNLSVVSKLGLPLRRIDETFTRTRPGGRAR